MLRIRAEEQLLLVAFGDTYRNYARTVPVLIPWWHGV
jgi:protein-S-isoprenylcysteine O-methyltransferase Ste14